MINCRYGCFNKAPTSGYKNRNDLVIYPLDFIEEIKEFEKKRPRSSSGIISVTYLREISYFLQNKYDKNFNPYRNIIPSNYAGVQCLSVEEVAAVLRRMFNDGYPQIYGNYIRTKISQRSVKCTKIYYIGKESDIEKIMQEFKIPKATKIKPEENVILIED